MSHYQDPGVLNIKKIFVGGLTSTTSESKSLVIVNKSVDSLRKHFEKYGELTDCCIMLDRDTNP